MITRTEIIDICQISRTVWMKWAFEGMFPFENKPEYSSDEGIDIIKFWRYAKPTRKAHNDYGVLQLCEFLNISHPTYRRQLKNGTLPPPDKGIGFRKVYSKELAERIKASGLLGKRHWAKAHDQGFFTIKAVAEMCGINRTTFNSRMWAGQIPSPMRQFGKRFFYSKRDVMEIKRFLKHPNKPFDVDNLSSLE